MPAGIQSKYKLLKSSSYSILKAHTYTEREGFWGVSPPSQLRNIKRNSYVILLQLLKLVSRGLGTWVPSDDVKTIYWLPRYVFNDTISATGTYISVGTVTRLRNGQSRDRRSIPGRDKRHLPCPNRPYWVWGSISLLQNRSRPLFLRG